MTRSKEINKFKDFLTECGAVLVPETNEWEVCRFKTSNGVSIIYTNRSGYNLTFTNEAREAWDSFQLGNKWKAVDRKRKVLTDKKMNIATRDGMKCFFCNTIHETVDTLTVEHILSIRHGGSDNLNNLALACETCNKELGTLSVTNKILFRERKLHDLN